MALNDKVAQQIMGEIDTLTKQIDKQIALLASTSHEFSNAASLIKVNSTDAVKNAKEAVRLAQIEGAARAEACMTTAAAKALNSVASAVAIKSAAKWVIGGVILSGLLTISAGWIGYTKGNEAGKTDGYARSKNEVAAASWANTEEGLLARQLAEAGSITALATCDEKLGWKLEKKFCYPLATEKGTYGWKILK